MLARKHGVEREGPSQGILQFISMLKKNTTTATTKKAPLVDSQTLDLFKLDFYNFKVLIQSQFHSFK